MKVSWRVAFCLVVLGSLSSVHAQDCNSSNGVDTTTFSDMLVKAAKPTPESPGPAVVAVAAAAIEAPSSVPSAKQLSAPSASSTSPDIVTGTDFSNLIGVAVDAGLISNSSGATTLDLNAFAFISALQPRVVQEQELYERFENARRFGGNVTFGGNGDAFDQDGDGKIDEAKVADKSTDIVTWELRYRIRGSRDRRDPQNYRKIFSVTANADSEILSGIGPLVVQFLEEHPDQKGAPFFCLSAVKDFMEKHKDAVERLALKQAALTGSYDAITNEVDRSFLLTAAIGGTDRNDEELGADKQHAGLRASWGLRESSVEANLDYAKTKAFRGTSDSDSTKLAVSYNATYLKDLVGPKKEGIALALSAAWEKYRDVPNAAHDNVAKVNIKITYPISDSVKLPLSVTWANHTDLLDGEKEIRANIGFTYDLSPLFKPAVTAPQ